MYLCNLKGAFVQLFLLIQCLSLCYLVQVVLSGKISVDLLELHDYRFGLGDPYVKFYERENYRGKVYFHILGKNCTNLPETRQDWASSVDVQKRCITVCDQLDCTGHCARIFPPGADPDAKGASRLHNVELNDKVKSVKFCYF